MSALLYGNRLAQEQFGWEEVEYKRGPARDKR
jgi:hypothetical protein